MKIIELESVDSTNEYCKRQTAYKNLIVTAKRQTGGKGTKGRSFVSDEGGLYISVMRRYDNFLSADAFKIMINACVAVCRTVESFGLQPVIRWANDVLVGGKKICGTLIENTFSGSYIIRSIVGMGINVSNRLPDELQNIATSINAQSGKNFTVREVRDTLVKNLQKNFTLSDYKSYINWLGKEIILKTSENEQTAVAVDIDYDGGLLCVMGGSVRKISAAEVSLRL